MLRRKYRVLESNNNDKKNAVAKFFGISPNSVKVSTVSGYDGPVTEAVVDGNTFWVLTEDEADREATSSFTNSFSGDMVEHDDSLRMNAKLYSVMDYDVVRDTYEHLYDPEEDSKAPEDMDEDDLYDWADETFSVEELWDNDMINKSAFCNNLWNMYGYGQELDMEQRTEDINWNGKTLYIILREGEWMDPKNESRRRRCSRRR